MLQGAGKALPTVQNLLRDRLTKSEYSPLGHWRASHRPGLATGPATASPGTETLRPEQVTEQPAFGQIPAEAPGGHAARGGPCFLYINT